MKKRAFTIVELLTILIILSILIIILIPTINRVASSSKENIRESKIKTITTAAEKYGNDAINDYQTCLGSLSSSELEKKCTISVKELIHNGYIKADENEEIKDPVSNEYITGRALLCYNPATTQVSASFIEDGIYSCKTINVDGSHILDLSSDGASIFIGSKEVIESNIISAGSFKGNFNLSVDIDDRAYIDYRIEDNKKLVIKATEEDLPINGDYKEIDIILRGYYVDNEGKDSFLEKHFTIKIYKSSLSISEPIEACIPVGGADEAEVFFQNAGMIEIKSSNDDILNATLRDNKLLVTAGSTPGEGIITLTEKNGNNQATYKRIVYDLKLGDSSEELIINTNETIKLTHKSTGPVTITSTNPNVLKLKSLSNPTPSDKIILDNELEEEFQVVATSVGDASIVLEASEGKCGKIDRSFQVINMSLESINAKIYVGGDNFKNIIHAKNTNDLTCTSSDIDAATCSIENNILTVKPGSKSKTGVVITVSGKESGTASMYVDVLDTSINVINDNEEKISEICSELNSGINSEEIKVRGNNIDDVKIYSDNDIVNANISKELSDFRIHLTESDRGKNTGQANITVHETNGNKKTSFKYNLYALDISENEASINVGSSTSFEITSRGSGKLVINNSNPDIVSIQNNDDGVYDTNNNTVKKVIVKITGKKVGTAIIKVRGSLCGERTFTIHVAEQEYSINLEKGTYTSELVTNKLFCSVEEASDSCTVTLPEFYTTDAFKVVGYSKLKDDKTFLYKGGEQFTINSSNTGTTLYANSIEEHKPKCVFKNVPTSIKKDSELDILIECFDEDTYLDKDTELKTENFLINNSKGSIISVGNKTALENGYSFTLRVKAQNYGMFRLILKDNVVQDQFGNTNEGIFTNLIVSSNDPIETWEIGRINKSDIVAAIYNKENGKFSLKFYGTGEMHGFLNDEYPSFAPWGEDEYWKNVSDVEFENGITNIGSSAFYNIQGLDTLNLADSILVIEASAFEGAHLETIDFPNQLISIEKRAFYYNNFHKLTFPSSLKLIGESAFSREFSTDLESIEFEINSKLESIGPKAFQYHKFEKIDIPESVQEIGDYAFYQTDTTLHNVSFNPNSQIKKIGKYAFAGSDLTTFTLPTSLESLGEYAISSLNGISSIIIGPNLKEFDEAAITGIGLKEFVVDPNNPNFISIDGVLYTKDQKTLIKCPDDYGITSTLTIPLSTITLEKGSFIGTINTNSKGFDLKLSNSIQELNIDNNFKGMSISNIDLNNENFETVEGVIFNKNKTIAYRLPCALDKTSYSLPSSTQKIDNDFAYANYKVKTMNIPNSVKEIGQNAFKTDPKYALNVINLQINSDTVIETGAFDLMNFDNDEEFSQREIEVKNNTLKNLLDEEYSNKYMGKIVITVT